MKAVYKFSLSFSRGGDLSGIFIEDTEVVQTLFDKKIPIYFGEVNGKHSEVVSVLDADDITFVSDNPELVKVFEEFDLPTGCNPFEYGTTSEYLDSLANPQDDCTIRDICRLFIPPSNP